MLPINWPKFDSIRAGVGNRIFFIDKQFQFSISDICGGNGNRIQRPLLDVLLNFGKAAIQHTVFGRRLPVV